MITVVLCRFGGESGKRRHKAEGERRKLNPEAGFLSSLPMKYLNACKKKKKVKEKESGLLPLLLLDGLQSMISDYEKCGPYLQWIVRKQKTGEECSRDIICAMCWRGADLT